jgi:hypothetical protein
VKITIESSVMDFAERKRRATTMRHEDRAVLSVESDERHDTFAKHMNYMADQIREIGARGTP